MPDQPNIIFIITDQQRSDTIQATGADWMITPNLDRLAEGAVAFERAFCCAATCIASRSALFTGMYAHNTGVYTFNRWEHHRTWLHDFRDAGYYLTNIGKMHQRDAQMAFHERFIVENKSSRLKYDQWNRYLWISGLDVPKRIDSIPDWPKQLNAVEWPHDEMYHSDVFTGNAAISFIERWDQRAPLFLQIGFPGPHEPYDPPGRFLELYKDVSMPGRIFEPGELDSKPPEQKQFKTHFEHNNYDNSIDFTAASRADIDRMRRHYCANMTAIDEKIGQIMAALDAKGMLENAIIVFTSDHGDNLGDHDLPYKWFMYDSVTNIPLMIRTPRTVGRIDQSLFSQIDIGPTLLELAGIPLPSRLDGRSRLARIEDGDTSDAPETVYAQENHLVMVRTQAHKLVYYIDQPYGELYDLMADPKELRNLYDDPESKSIRGELEARLFAWLAHSTYHNSGYKNHSDPMYRVRTNDMIEYD
jgi:arylsulfatase A-like enzyme